MVGGLFNAITNYRIFNDEAATSYLDNNTNCLVIPTVKYSQSWKKYQEFYQRNKYLGFTGRGKD